MPRQSHQWHNNRIKKKYLGKDKKQFRMLFI